MKHVNDDHLVPTKEESDDERQVKVHEVHPLDLILLPILHTYILNVSFLRGHDKFLPCGWDAPTEKYSPKYVLENSPEEFGH
jgi:hypothetical protein